MSGFKGTPGAWINVGGWVDSEGTGRITICKMGQIIRETTEEVQDANANLISAAPDLLEALISARKELEMYEGELTGEVYNNPAINAAINKALGVIDE